MYALYFHIKKPFDKAVPWTFGVEVEVGLAFIYPNTVPLPDLSGTQQLDSSR